MRTLSALALAKLQTRLGNEPVVIVEIQWIRDGGWQAYADRDIAGGVKGKILELSDLDDVVAITDNNDSQEIQVTFDDTDGTLKNILDSTDIHKRDVRVWQWFEGLALTDKFLLFCGKINSPIVWNEGEQTVSFSIVSQIEDKEFGFSPEEGQFPYIPVELIGQAWPSCFGTPLDVPCVAIGSATHGTSLAGLGILSGSTFYNPPVEADTSGLAIQQIQKGHVSLVSSCWLGTDDNEYEKYNDQRSQLDASINAALEGIADSVASQNQAAAARIADVLSQGLGTNPVRILGGQDFPRNMITLDINGGLFTGYFGNTVGVDDDLFTIISRNHPENLAAYNNEVAEAQASGATAPGPGGEFNFYSKVPCGKGDFGDQCYIRTEGTIYSAGVSVSQASPVSPKHFWADAGSAVTLYGNEPITYIVSIVPGTVLSVKAFKTFNGVRHLVDVPTNYYYTETKVYGSITAVQVVFYKTLSTITGQNWGDDVYVTFESSVGPNIVDILEYIIDIYTEFAIDSTSFDHVRIRLEPFPANFAVLDRKNVITVLQEIAFQARCSLRLINGIFYLTYLAEEPDSSNTITESDIEFNSILVSGSATEDLVTKMVIEWRISYAHDKLNRLILRHNVGYYGVHEETTEFYIYNQPDIILKAATFWLIRKSNTWKQINFRTFLHKLNIETLDCITLNFEKNYVAAGLVKGIVKKANFNSADQLIDLECWLPIKFGTLMPYDFAWPADVSPEWIYPTDYEVHWGHSGGAWIGEAAEGELPLGEVKDTASSETQYISGGGGGTSISRSKHGTDNRNHDAGDRHPSDTGFIPGQEPSGGASYAGQVISTPNPVSSPIQAPIQTPYPDIQTIPLVSDGVILDLSKTKVRDSVNASEEAIAYLSDILHFDTNNNKLCLKHDIWIWDEEHPDKEFDFQFDADGDIWGAGTAWLKPS